MDVYFYNTLTHKKEKFVPVEPGKAKIYNCGPTVYDDVHIGNLFSYTFRDILTRTLKFLGYKTTVVMNVTDVGHLVSDEDTGEDKLEKRAKEKKMSAQEVAKFFTDRVFKDFKKMNYLPADYFPRAADHVKEMIAIIKKLEAGGYTYITELGVYFDVSKFKDYGRLSGQKLEDKMSQVREDLVADPEKKHPADFALWLFTKGEHAHHEMKWDSPWGEGFPGWHIECSAMSEKYLGLPLDIHTGGMDNMPVHHENEIAQTESASGKKMANFWMHNEMIMVDGEKMSKSKGNFYTLADVEQKGFNPLTLRYSFLNTHYRTRFNFSWDSMAAARTSRLSLLGYVKGLSYMLSVGRKKGPEEIVGLARERKVEKSYFEGFKEKVADDLNVPAALGVMWEMVKDEGVDPEDQLAMLLQFDAVLGLKLAEAGEEVDIEEGKKIEALVSDRDTLRKSDKWKEADKVREQIEKLGVELEDTSAGPVWRWIK